MNQKNASASVWEPLVYFWNGGWIGVGPARDGTTVPAHAHHAIQISLGLQGPIRLRREDGDWVELAGAVVLPDVTHSFDARASWVAMIFIDPEGTEGRWLRDSIPSEICEVERERFAEHSQALLAFRDRLPSPDAAAHLITAIVRGLCAGPPPLKRLDPRVARVLEVIGEQDVRQLSLEKVAKSVFLSPSRFAHLFKEEVGLPFRRYLLWRKLNRAMEEFGRGSNLTNAAYVAGFSDSAHLTHTWRQMFGLSPSAMVGSARFYEIPAPFELTVADVSRA